MKLQEAAEVLGIPTQSLRLWLQSGHCPFGQAWKGKGKGFQYYIAPNRLQIYLNGEDMKKGPGTSLEGEPDPK